MPSRHRRSSWPAVLLTAMFLGGCGSGADLGRGGSPPGTGPGSAPAVVPVCADIEPLGPIAEGNKVGMVSPDPLLMGALQTYGAEHADTFAGAWIDRDHGGTVVLAFTDDPANHRAEILARRASPDDTPIVVPPPSITETTTVGESGWVVDVVRAQFSEARLREIQAQVTKALDGTGIRVSSAGVDVMKNRVKLTAAPSDEAARTLMARHLPVDEVCAEVTRRDPAVDVPRPSTLIPAEGSDPYVLCSSLPVRRSALDDPPVLAEDDPLMVAFRQSAATGNASSFPGGADDWYLLGQQGDRALFVNGRPPSGSVTMERRNGRWLWAGSASGGAACDRVLLPEGVGAVSWSLDPAFPPPGPADTTVHLLINEQSCTGGQAIGDRLVTPEIRATSGQMLIGLGAHSLPPGAYTCQGNPGEALAVTLPEPLGGRTLADGTVVPPR